MDEFSMDDQYTPAQFVAFATCNVFGGLFFGLMLGSTDPLFQYFSYTMRWDSAALWSIAFFTGAAPIAMLGGNVADKLGRTICLRLIPVCALLGTLIMCAGRLMSAGSPSYWVIVLGRFICGGGVGMAMVVCPLITAEYSPLHYAAPLGTFFQVFVCLGILLGAAYSILLQFLFTEVLLIRDLALMLLVAIPTAAFIPISAAMPAHPCRAVVDAKAAIDSAANESSRLQAEGHVNTVDLATEEATAVYDPARLHTSGGQSFLPHDFPKKALLCGCIIAAASQLTGINAALFFAPEVMTFIKEPLLADLLFAAWNFLTSMASIPLLSRLHPSKVLIASLVAMGIASLVIAYGSTYPSMLSAGATEAVSLLAIMVFVAGFEVGPGPLLFVFASSLFTDKYKARGCSAVLGFQLIFTIVVPFVYQSLVEVGVHLVWLWLFFGVYGLVSVPPLVALLPKGRSLVLA